VDPALPGRQRSWARGPGLAAPLRHGDGSARPAPGPDAGLSALV